MVLHGEWNDVIQQLVVQPDYSIGRVDERLNTKREARDNQRGKSHANTSSGCATRD